MEEDRRQLLDYFYKVDIVEEKKGELRSRAMDLRVRFPRFYSNIDENFEYVDDVDDVDGVNDEETVLAMTLHLRLNIDILDYCITNNVGYARAGEGTFNVYHV